MKSLAFTGSLIICSSVLLIQPCTCNPYADQLYEDLLYWYQKNVIPVQNASDVVRVKFSASLIRIIELDELSQILTTNLWLEMGWMDVNLVWNPDDYDGITQLHMPTDQIWVPDIVLYNNAAGYPQITIATDAIVQYDGTVCWKPPAIYNSFCAIDIEYFPYDVQTCILKFGGWTYHGQYMDMVHMVVKQGEEFEHPCPPINGYQESANEAEERETQCNTYLNTGMDLSNFQPFVVLSGDVAHYDNQSRKFFNNFCRSAEWDLLLLESRKYKVVYKGCCGTAYYPDIRFAFGLRRKPLFFTVNLVIPCMLIAILTTFVFYVPSFDHKITFAISILVTLIFFYLVLIDLIPPTSLVIPLIGKYLLFTIMLVFVATIVSVITLNLFHRSGATHSMPKWVRWLFLKKLPGPLCIKPQEDQDSDSDESDDQSTENDFDKLSKISLDFSKMANPQRKSSPYFMSMAQYANTQIRLSQLAELRGMHPDLIRRMVDNVSYIAEHYRALQAKDKVSEDWSYVAMVLDRLFLIIFTVVNILGTVIIILQAPSLYDNRPAMMPTTPPLNALGGECAFLH